jgi:agmatinase
MEWEKILPSLYPYLCPAGNGVFTVSTGSQYKKETQKLLYNSDNKIVIEERWRTELENGPQSNTPLILGIPSDAGGGIQRGANWGPLLLRQFIYKKYSHKRLFDLGDVRVIPQLLSDDLLNSKTLKQCRQALYNDPLCHLPVSPLSIAEKVSSLLHQVSPKVRLLTLGGDHSISYPLVKSFLEEKKRQGIVTALLQFDAHTDLLDRRLGIDICFGTWMFHALNYLPSPSHLIQIGIRASSKNKSYWENHLGISQYWAKEMREKGIPNIANDILKILHEKKVSELYVTVDIDALDATEASATGTPESGGLMTSDILTIIDSVGSQICITGADIAEVAPFISFKNDANEPERTLRNARDIALCLIKYLS